MLLKISAKCVLIELLLTVLAIALKGKKLLRTCFSMVRYCDLRALNNNKFEWFVVETWFGICGACGTRLSG